VVQKRSQRHPIIRAEYVSGREKVICTRKWEANRIWQAAELLRNSSGAKLKKIKRFVVSQNLATRGIWSPIHAEVHRP